MVDRQGPHGGAERGALDEGHQAAHQEQADDDEADLHIGQVHVADEDAARREEVRRIGLDGTAPDQLGGVLEKYRHAERRDQDRQERPFQERFVGELEDAQVHSSGAEHGHDERDDKGQVDG